MRRRSSAAASSATARSASRASARAAGSGCTGSGPRRSSRSRSPATGGARSSSRRAPKRSGSAPSSSAPPGPAGTTTRRPYPLDAAVTFAPAGEVVVAALRAVDRGGTVAINAIHLDGIPAFHYDLLWWERSLRSVANFTRRDAEELLALASAIPIRTSVARYPLEAGNAALAALAAGAIEGAAVLEIG